MINPTTSVGKIVADGTLANKIMNLGKVVERMKDAAGVFQIIVFFRVIALLCNFSRRLDTLNKTVFRSFKIMTFYLLVLLIIILGFSGCCTLFYGDAVQNFSSLWKACIAVVLIILKDNTDMDAMYQRNPNVTTTIYVLIMVTVRFIMYYIFFSLVYAAFMYVEERKKEKVVTLDNILSEKHCTNKIKDFFKNIKDRCLLSKQRKAQNSKESDLKKQES